jgi:hypothetical protein
MKTWLTAIGLITLLATASPPLFAQWGRYPTPGVPRTPDGKPNLSAPAPKTADGKPDRVTIDDPKAYTKPFTVRVDQRIMVDDEMIEFICAENEKSVAHMVGK